MPAPSTSPIALAPFVTSVRWTPQPLRRDLLTQEPSNSHLLIAVGDRQGRIAIWDFRLRQVLVWMEFDPPSSFSSSDKSKLGIQDIYWIRAKADSWILASISGLSLLSLWNTSTGRCIWKYDASPEFFSCIQRDPFDFRHFCALGLKGFLLSVMVHGDEEGDIVIKELKVPTATDFSELHKVEKDGGANSTTTSPALAVFPLFRVRFSFSPHWRHILFVSFPKELIVFDLQYETSLSSAALPRKCGKFLDVLPDPDNDWLYCAHFDGKLSTWRRKEGEQAYTMCVVEELMPSIGTSVPSPIVLAVIRCQSVSTLQNVVDLYSNSPHTSPFWDYDTHLDRCSKSILNFMAHLLSITDDGKIWNWLLTAEGARDAQKPIMNPGLIDAGEVRVEEIHTNRLDTSIHEPVSDANKESESAQSSSGHTCNSTHTVGDLSFKIDLVGQLHLLSSTVTTLAVPSPSLTATLARGGNNPAVAVPLIALGTQSGTIEVIDVSANAVAASFSVHNSTIRGLRWLGNSRLVSFSFVQVNEKAGGYTNRLVVTCVRSGLNRAFRVLQKTERAPIRALKASSSGRYLVILLRDAPVEVWAMTKSPIMLRSLALPFTVLEWTLPTVPHPVHNGPSKQSSISSKEHSDVASPAASPTQASSSDSTTNLEASTDDAAESFSFALVNGALGVFEVHGRRIRDFRPKWPSTSFVSSDGLVTAMAYRLPHVVMGDRSGNIRWWDVTSGLSSSFNTHREGIRRIKFSPVVAGDRSRGRIAVLFYDNTFSIFDLDSQDPLANSLLQPQFPGTLVLELDWLSLRTDKNEPLVLCIAGADSSFRLIEVNISDKRSGFGSQPRAIKERFRPMPLCSPILLPTPHALALRMVLQLGVKPSWFNTFSMTKDKDPYQIHGAVSSKGDLRGYMIDSHLPNIGDSVVPEMLLKVLEPYRKDGCILDDETAKIYASVVNKGSAARFAFAAAVFGEYSEALFWLHLPRALPHFMNKSAKRFPQKASVSTSAPELGEPSTLSRITSRGRSVLGKENRDTTKYLQLKSMAFDQEELWESANERIPWHEKLEGEEAIQNHVHELVSVGNLEAAVSLLLSTPPESSYFYVNALRAVALSSAVSRSLHELAVKVVAANMVRTDKSLSGTHLLCAVGRYQEACSQLQDAGFWTDAATLAATHLQGSDYARVLQRWADHVLHAEHNIWR
uniref:WD repeat-containing protein 11 n=1 Tax=Nelumbo nucifera TaxID=4432 RepID=A0A822ZNK9_NELNU|nr:TPA_asm: hypothetical protein HUJ06_003179 [Nelumbo nucifera]